VWCGPDLELSPVVILHILSLFQHTMLNVIRMLVGRGRYVGRYKGLVVFQGDWLGFPWQQSALQLSALSGELASTSRRLGARMYNCLKGMHDELLSSIEQHC